MTQFIALITGTLREAKEKKIILTIFIFISILVLLSIAFINLDSVESMHELMKQTDSENFERNILIFEVQLINQFSFLVVLCLLIIMSASFIPSMLEQGNIDVLLSKPISRAKIVIAKFLSAILLALVVISVLILIIWLIISVKSSVWHFSFLSSIPWFVFIFAVLYSLLLFIGFVSKSTILSLLITLVILFPVSALLSVRNSIEFVLVKSDIAVFITNFFYYILPKPWDLREICENIILGSPVNSYEPVITSALFMIAMLALSILYFSRRDY